MQLDEALRNVSVIGAGGKMGSGISLLLLQEMARLEAEKTGKVGSGAFRLDLIDQNERSLDSLRHYFREQTTKYAEKNINALRRYFANNPRLISNAEMIEAFVEGALDNVHFDTTLEKAKSSNLIFEAILEDVETKVQTFKKIHSINPKAQFLTNTSSIPISLLDKQADLQGQVIGFHFYNPPAVQKLVEIIEGETTHPSLKILSFELAKRLQKKIVKSNDTAGFIGNGHFIREITFACQKVQELQKQHSLEEAVYLVNRVTQDWLLRPMGIFQLIDYVGIDVCQKILGIMHTYLNDETLHAEIIDQMVKIGVFGGQNSDGSQKNGFFQYDSKGIKGIYSLSKNQYLPINEVWMEKIDTSLGKLPEGYIPWKKLQFDPLKKEKIEHYFKALSNSITLGASLAKDFLFNSDIIAQNLVKEHTADSIEDVNQVLMNGFFHLYGSHNLSTIDPLQKKEIARSAR